MQGTVKWFNDAKGFGFISGPNGEDVFVHFRDIVADGFRRLREGERVEFEAIAGPKGQLARSVRVVTDTQSPKPLTAVLALIMCLALAPRCFGQSQHTPATIPVAI